MEEAQEKMEDLNGKHVLIERQQGREGRVLGALTAVCAQISWLIPAFASSRS